MKSDRYLLHDEEILAVARRHWVVLAGPALATVGVMVVAAAAGYLAGPETAGDVVDVVFGSMAGIALLRFAWLVGAWWATRMVVTNKRVVTVAGMLGRRVAGVPVADVAMLTYRRSVMGRLWGYGDFVASAGPGRVEFRRVAEPDSFYRAVHRAAAGPERFEVPIDPEDTGPLPVVRPDRSPDSGA